MSGTESGINYHDRVVFVSQLNVVIFVVLVAADVGLVSKRTEEVLRHTSGGGGHALA